MIKIIVPNTQKVRNGKNDPISTSADVDAFISHLYRSAPLISPDQYRSWALEQLSRVIEFDAAIWVSGNRSAERIYVASQQGLDEHFFQKIKDSLTINPIYDRAESNLGQAVDMADVISDQDFYQSQIYLQVFQPYGIERILASAHFDENSGLHSLLSIYRSDREHAFNEEERELQQRLIYHLVSAVSYAFFLHLRIGSSLQQTEDHSSSAICDRDGWFHEVQPGFTTLLNEHFPERKMAQLPVPIPLSMSAETQIVKEGALSFELRPQGDLIIVTLRAIGPLDLLSEREKEVVDIVCKGLSFKETGRILGLATSTVSNHIYRCYEKLGITSRSELARMVNEQPGIR